jgi:hypothetical protein
MDPFIAWLIALLWLCVTVYFLVKDAILAYLTIKAFLTTAALANKVEEIPHQIALRIVNVILATAILAYWY